MFKRNRRPQLSIYDFTTPFGVYMNEEHKHTVMLNPIHWDYID